MHVFLRLSVFLICLPLILGGCGGVRVRRGDTLYSIARKHDVPMRAIIERNNLKPPYTLSVGQYLYFPREKTYRVRRGDTLYSIASRNDMSVNALARLNSIQPPYQLRPGQLLKISSWGESTQVATTSKSGIMHGQGSVNQDRQAEVSRRKNVKNPAAFKGKANVPRSQSGKRFARPASGKIIANFGNGNDGINIAGKMGAPVKAADTGTVAYAGNELKGYGNLILVKHKDGWITAYAHNDKLLVKKGDIIKKGQKIAEMGKTGNVKTPQLHFEVRYKAKVVNPNQYMK